ncbi:hypothetical protein CJ030_MR3G011094 [Morella rubra]|uniref:Uncharacterized protein n=1 Tax=Morella rubra TaxID=262757 RepID=A0A6A1W5P7_9ROSI|nr:hypothetical protein CJ030_MR3G011094 [Morella rubra]
MGTEGEPEPSSAPMLPVFSIPTLQSTEPSGMQTPPLHTSASVPFRWEEEPGKPRPCTALTTLGDITTRCLELPPRLLLDAKLPSPTAVEGPYVGRSKFLSARISRECYGSFSHERRQIGAITVGKRALKERGWFGSWSRRAFKGKREVGGCSHVFPSSVDRESDSGNAGESSKPKAKMTKIQRTGSLSSHSHSRSHLWVTIYEGLKQVVPWGNRKLKKDGLLNSELTLNQYS